MSDLIEDEAPAGNMPEFSVSEISGAVKRMIEGEFGHVRVRGEVGRVSRPRSGHVYLDLKDDRAVLAGVIWKGVAAGLQVQPEEGMEVVATGRLTTFPGQSRYQIVIESVAPAGVGALMAMLEKRRRLLAAEGLFDETQKRPLPYLPRVIGVVTSPSGAVIRDILHRLTERFPVRVLVWPVAVQGERCAPEVAAAIRGFSDLPADGVVPRPDVVIVARGGGSVEDLWGFNEEEVVRAAAASTVPVISAVGHETDWTLIDHAADRRAPTPTAAAEMAVPVRAELAAAVADLEARRLRALQSGMERRRQRFSDLVRALPRADQILAERRQRLDLATARLLRPDQILAERRQKLDLAGARLGRPDRMIAELRQSLALAARGLGPALARRAQVARLELTRRSARLDPERLRDRIAARRDRLAAWSDRLPAPVASTVARTRDRLDALGRTLNAVSYRGTLARGYSVIRGADDTVVTSAAAVTPGLALDLEFADGHARAIAEGAPRRTRTPRRDPGPDDAQGTLL